MNKIAYSKSISKFVLAAMLGGTSIMMVLQQISASCIAFDYLSF